MKLDLSTNGSEERQYLDLVSQIISAGIRRDDRTATGTVSIFGTQSRYSLREGELDLASKGFWLYVSDDFPQEFCLSSRLNLFSFAEFSRNFCGSFAGQQTVESLVRRTFISGTPTALRSF